MSLATGESKKNDSKKSWLPESWGVRFAIAVSGTALAWWCQIYWINGRSLSLAQAELFTLPFLLVSLICVTFPFWIVQLLLDLLIRTGKWGGTIGALFVFAFSVLFMSYIFPDQRIFWVAFIGLTFLYFMTMQKIKRWTYGLTSRGKYDRALVVNRRFSWLPGYGSSLEGPILFNSGLYAEAAALVKPKAFDEHGNPLLKSTDFYVYVLSLVNNEHEAEAEKLLKLAVQTPPCKDAMKVALAACLLTECKEPEYARKLMEEAMAGPQKPITAYGEHADRARRIAQYSWALASCGSLQGAEARIQEAFAVANGLNGSDLAGIHYYAGEAWRALGLAAKARAEFQEALTLAPEGVTALSARKALAKMDGK
jgi:hypothetical protein